MQIAHQLHTIQQHLNTHPLALLYVQAPNCGVCTVFHPQIETLLAEMPNIAGIETNIADVPSIAGAYHIMTAPAVLLFADGKEVWRGARFIDLPALRNVMSQYSRHYV